MSVLSSNDPQAHEFFKNNGYDYNKIVELLKQIQSVSPGVGFVLMLGKPTDNQTIDHTLMFTNINDYPACAWMSAFLQQKSDEMMAEQDRQDKVEQEPTIHPVQSRMVH